MSGITIYRASAGSGKTFSLVAQYIKLLFNKPDDYRRILAVTFTNKATAEMKERIVKELVKLSDNQESPYFNMLKDEFELEAKQIQQRARIILLKILHDYSHFSLDTIDSFFQKIIRSFTRELGIQYGYNLVIDSGRVLEDVVQIILKELENSSALKDWLTEFATEKIAEGKTWNIKREVFSFAKEIFTEVFAENSRKILTLTSDKQAMKKLVDEINAIIYSFEHHMAKLGNEATCMIDKAGLEAGDFFHGNKGVATYFKKITSIEKIDDFKPNSYVLKAFNDNVWSSKSSDKKVEIDALVNAGLGDKLAEILRYKNQKFDYYNSAVQVKKNMYVLGILSDVITKLREYAEENNLFLLSDSSVLLNEIIDNNDAPFVYEKVGSYFHHFMIDEFQDTSVKQWQNFRPLLQHSVSNQNVSLVVGDVKQAIYRWRNGDWSILQHAIENDFRYFDNNIKSLQTNWRSLPGIIDFNNRFFKSSTTLLQQDYTNQLGSEGGSEIAQLYADVQQETAKTESDNTAYKQFNLIEQKGKDTEWKEESLEKTLAQIRLLQDNGYSANDMAVLVRSKAEGVKLAHYLIGQSQLEENNAYNMKVISNEALFVSSAWLVQFFISCIRYLYNKNDELSLINAAYILHVQLIGDGSTEARKKFFVNKTHHLETLSATLIAQRTQNIFELIESLYVDFIGETQHGEESYYFAFMDVVHEFVHDKSNQLGEFLDFWDETGYQQSIRTNEAGDAIQILTIHKSKGLEFKCVLIPFLDWELESTGSIASTLWVKTDVAPFNQLPVIPVRYSGGLEQSVFKTDYHNEKLHQYIDNMNLLYVAFTRAEECLLVNLPVKADNKKSDGLKRVSKLVLESLKEMGYDIGQDKVEIGKLTLQKKEKLIAKKDAEVYTYATSVKPDIQLRKQLNEESERFEPLRKGRIMHKIFEHVKSVEHIEYAVKRAYLEGFIDEAEQSEYTKQVKQLIMSNLEVNAWFSGNWKIVNERSIIQPDENLKRPDRVLISGNAAKIIDYKFETLSESHKAQVKTYMDLLHKMGYEKVEGFLWYLNSNEIVEVK